MRLVLATIFLSFFLCASQAAQEQQQSPIPATQPRQHDTLANPTITIPAGTKVVLSLTSPVWSKTVQVGDRIFAATAFPVAVDGQMAIPPGTYVEGRIDALKHPTRRKNEAQFQLHFTKLIFVSGYTVLLSDVSSIEPAAAAPHTVVQPTTPQAAASNIGVPSSTLASATASVYIQVSFASDLLLDNGAQFEMDLQSPLSLDARSVALAVRNTPPPQIASYKSSTHCVPRPGTPGTSDTVIPGTPGTPGTPDTVIPGGPGMPPTVIPGTPSTPGTPPTIIPGTPGTPGFSCPGPPLVTSGPISGPSTTHKKSVTTSKAYDVAGHVLPKGKYKISWTEPGPETIVEFSTKDKVLFRVAAKIVLTDVKAKSNEFLDQTNPDGTSSLTSLQLSGETSELHLEVNISPGATQTSANSLNPVQP